MTVEFADKKVSVTLGLLQSIESALKHTDADEELSEIRSIINSEVKLTIWAEKMDLMDDALKRINGRVDGRIPGLEDKEAAVRYVFETASRALRRLYKLRRYEENLGTRTEERGGGERWAAGGGMDGTEHWLRFDGEVKPVKQVEILVNPFTLYRCPDCGTHVATDHPDEVPECPECNPSYFDQLDYVGVFERPELKLEVRDDG